MAIAAIDRFDALPRVDGPKLPRFKNGRYDSIKYLNLLSEADDEQSPDGDHGYVFKVCIDGELYALKVVSVEASRTFLFGTDLHQFRFFDVDEILGMLDPAGRSRVSREEIEGQTDPFYAECRAYQRIAESGKKRAVAVKCHGFISIAATQETFFDTIFGIVDWNRPQEELDLPLSKQQPFRALVKDLVEKEPAVTKRLVSSMWRQLRDLNRLRIYVMDIKWDNYRGGRLVDFSVAWTEPHFEFREDINSAEEINMNRQLDTIAFDKMVKKELDMDIFWKAEKKSLRTRKQTKKYSR